MKALRRQLFAVLAMVLSVSAVLMASMVTLQAEAFTRAEVGCVIANTHSEEKSNCEDHVPSSTPP